MKLTIAIFLALLAGCGGTWQGVKADSKAMTTPEAGSPAAVADAENQSALQVKLTSDLTQAIKEAKAATDPVAPLRVICYETVLSLVPELPQFPSIGDKGASAGIFTTFERGAELAENAATITEFQIPPDVRVRLLKDCGPVGQAARDLLLKFNVRLVRAAGRVALIAK